MVHGISQTILYSLTVVTSSAGICLRSWHDSCQLGAWQLANVNGLELYTGTQSDHSINLTVQTMVTTAISSIIYVPGLQLTVNK